MSATQTDLAWLAGFLDGEGTIGLHRSNAKSYPHPYLRPHVQAPNTDRRLVEHAADVIERAINFRPAIIVAGHGTDRWKKSWRVQLKTQTDIAVLLPMIAPYLVSKKRQAELVFEFCRRRGARLKYKWYEFKEMDEAAYHECLALNRRGVDGNAEKPNAKPELRIVKEA